jgi:hypothetical protein
VENALELNVGYCKSITFSRLRHPIEFSYMLGRNILDRVNSINDLGVIMDIKMSFTYLMLRLERLWQCWGLLRGCRVSLGTLRPFYFSLCA